MRAPAETVFTTQDNTLHLTLTTLLLVTFKVNPDLVCKLVNLSLWLS